MRTFLLLIVVAAAARATDCRLSFADQSDWNAKRGFYVGIENDAPGSSACALSTLRVAMGVADGSQWRFIVYRPPAWQTDHDYRVRVTITPSSFEMHLDERLAGRVQGSFAGLPAAALTVNLVPSWAAGASAYVATQKSVQVSATGGAQTAIDNFGAADRPLPLRLLAPGVTPQQRPFSHAAGETITVEAVFRIEAATDVRQFAPFFDRYGQSIHAAYAGKINADEDLQRAGVEEERQLAEWGIPPGFDRYGGLENAGWTETPTGYYRVVQRAGVWWLVTPLGNPCFYIGMDNAPALTWDRTPVTGRTHLFEWLPPRTAPYNEFWGRNSWGQNDGTEDVGFAGINLLRKYGADWKTKAVDSAVRRAQVWGFSGFGKWDGNAGVPVLPVLSRWDVPVVDRHPDVFDPAVRTLFRASLERQIAPRRTDPRVVGWSLGNEYDEIVTADETRNLLGKSALTPVKRALVDYALQNLYGGDLAKLAASWRIAAATTEAAYAAKPTVPPADVEALRRHYARNYYEFVYRTVKELDPNHLYFGFWIVQNWWENEADWDMIAEFVDVVGYDRYAATFSDDALDALILRTAKPVLCGEFGFPTHYDLRRGFRQYQAASAPDDAAAGAAYKRWVLEGARHPYAIGTAWFQYRDEPVSGRGPGQGPDLVYGEDFAFGAVDVGDRPKWDLVTQMREANLAAARRRLALRAPSLNPGGAVNNASFAAGAPVAPGSLISIFGVDLAGAPANAESLPLPVKLGGTTLRLGGVPVPVVHAVPPYQIDAVVPWELEGRSEGTLEIVTDGLAGNSIPVRLAAHAPGIFSGDASGRGQGAVLINGTRLLASPAASDRYAGRPARRGEWLNIFCTGLGPVNRPPATGAAAPADPPSTTVVPARVRIGGVEAPVNFSGLAAGFAGLYQVNAQVPAAAPSGDAVELTLEIGGAVSNTVTVAVE